MVHRGQAVVFRSIDDLRDRIDDPELPVTPQSVLVLQNAGPVGAPATAAEPGGTTPAGPSPAGATSGDAIPPTATISLSKVYTQSPSLLHYDYNTTFNAIDNQGGSGVNALYYYETGVQTLCSATSPCAALPNATASDGSAMVSNYLVPPYFGGLGTTDLAGSTTITFWAVDNAGNAQARQSGSLTISP